MLKRIFNTSSPVGIALTVAGVVLALSPEARNSVRRMLVKGTAAMLGAADQVKQLAADLANTGAVQKSSDIFSGISDGAQSGTEGKDKDSSRL